MIIHKWNDVEQLVSNIISSMLKDQWCPEIVTGIGPDGIIPATIISNYLDTELKLIHPTNDTSSELAELSYEQNKILIVDLYNSEYNDLIQTQWEAKWLSDSPDWNFVWNNTTRFATLVYDEKSFSKTEPDYIGKYIEGIEKNKFPWQKNK